MQDDVKIKTDSSFEKMEQFKYIETTLMNKNYIQGDSKC
jgi:hypothetical protein